MDFILNTAWSFLVGIGDLFSLLFWYAVFIVVLGLSGVLITDVNKSRVDKAIGYTVSVILIAMVLYPPWNWVGGGTQKAEGYHFLTTFRHTEKMSINTELLLIQFLIILITGLTFRFILKKYLFKYLNTLP